MSVYVCVCALVDGGSVSWVRTAQSTQLEFSFLTEGAAQDPAGGARGRRGTAALLVPQDGVLVI